MDREKIEEFVASIMLNYDRFYTKEVMKLIAQTKEYKWSIHNILRESIYTFTGEIVKPHEYDDIIEYYINKLYL